MVSDVFKSFVSDKVNQGKMGRGAPRYPPWGPGL